MASETREALLESRVDDDLQLMQFLFPVSPERHAERSGQCRNLVREAYERVQATFTENDALGWAQGFAFPAEVLAADAALFASHHESIEACATARRTELQPGKLNASRVDQWLSSDNPEFSRMLHLAEKGMPVPVPPDFESNSTTGFPPLRNTYRRLSSTVNRRPRHYSPTCGSDVRRRGASQCEFVDSQTG